MHVKDSLRCRWRISVEFELNSPIIEYALLCNGRLHIIGDGAV